MVDQVLHVSTSILSFNLADIAHHDVDKGVFYQAKEHKEGTG